MPIALTRTPSASLARCELTFLERGPIDIGRAREQHAAYVRALQALGARVTVLPPEDALPDAVFIEDPILVLDECAVLLPMGAESRRGEVPSVAEAVRPFRPLLRLETPGRVDGGDVLRIGRDLYVGRSPRTDDAGIAALRRLAEPLGYRVVAVDVTGCLHLKTGCTQVGGHVLINGAWVDPEPFTGLDLLPVPASEPWGANTLALAGRVLVSASHPETERLLRSHGYSTVALDVSELEKAEAGLTCMSVVFGARDARAAPMRRPPG